jgi:predicted transcriptional regulator
MGNFFGLGKKRTLLGKWLDKRGIAQEWLRKKTKLNKATVSDICNDEERMPSGKTMIKVLKALREIDPNVKQDDFWPM